MFKDSTPVQSNEETVIGPSVTVEGDFGGEGNIRVEGMVKGSIKTKQNLQIASTAKIHATIEAQNASIAGEVKGNIRIKEALEVLATARITGDIEARTITVASGAMLNGKIMTGDAPSMGAGGAGMPSQKTNQPSVRPQAK